MSNLFVVIMAGGKGERLWPLSRRIKPKQLLEIDGESLLQKTINRIAPLTTKNNIWIVTTKEQKDAINRAVGKTVGTILAEPNSCNTAPAILMACLAIKKISPDATIIFLPADHYIKQTSVFLEAIQIALRSIEKNNSMTLIGIKPTTAATGYGYIEYDKNTEDAGAYQVRSFHEKPSLDKALQYLSSDTMLWNAGIFCATVNTFIVAYQKHAPLIYHALNNSKEAEPNYEICPSISFDHAILEHTNKISVVPAIFDWSDVGNLETFLTLNMQAPADNKTVLCLNAQDNIIRAQQKLVVLIGVDDICFVQTDDAILIAKKTELEKVKEIVQLLKDHQKIEYL